MKMSYDAVTIFWKGGFMKKLFVQNFTAFVISVSIMLVFGCASSVTPILQYPLLGEKEDFATIMIKNEVTGTKSAISEFIVTDAQGEKKAYLPMLKDSMGTVALKAAYSWTPWGVATRIAHMNEGAIYHIPPIEMTLKIGHARIISSTIRGDTIFYKVGEWDTYITYKFIAGKEYIIKSPSVLGGNAVISPDNKHMAISNSEIKFIEENKK